MWHRPISISDVSSSVFSVVQPAIAALLICVASVSTSAAASLYGVATRSGADDLLKIDPATGAIQSLRPIEQTTVVGGNPVLSAYTGSLSGLTYEGGHLYSTTQIGPGHDIVEIDPATGVI